MFRYVRLSRIYLKYMALIINLNINKECSLYRRCGRAATGVRALCTFGPQSLLWGCCCWWWTGGGGGGGSIKEEGGGGGGGQTGVNVELRQRQVGSLGAAEKKQFKKKNLNYFHLFYFFPFREKLKKKTI